MTLPIWKSDWLIAKRRKRLLALNILIPLMLVAPISISTAPPAHVAAVFTVLFVIFGTFGSSIPIIRDSESGLFKRYTLTGVHPGGLVLQRLFASATLDILELTPSIVFIFLSRGAPLVQMISMIPALIVAIITANLIGAWAAAVARSIAEGALFSSVLALLLLHSSGTFRSPSPETWWATIERWAPFRHLHESFLEITGGSAITQPSDFLLPVLVLCAGLCITGAWKNI